MNLHAVLVRSENSSNVGASLRALKNIGGQRLILIDPQCELDHAARQMAAGAAHFLAEVTVHPTWQDFYAREPDGLRIALTRRAGRSRKVYALSEKLREAPAPRDLYLILGPEADGLSAEDMAFANFACHLPVHGEFASLNLSQAVLLAGFISREIFPPVASASATTRNEEPAAPFYFPDETIKEWLTAMGFDLRARKASAYLTLRRLFMHNRPTRHELHVLEAILRQNIRKLRGEPSVGFALEEAADDLGDVPGKKI